MYSPTEFPINVHRICGHDEMQNIRYKGYAEKALIMRLEGCFHCRECLARIKSWFDNPGDQALSIPLPHLKGTDKQIAWAKSIRQKNADVLLRVLCRVAAEGGEEFRSTWHAIYALLMEDEAGFWINNREIKFDADHFSFEASLFRITSFKDIHFASYSTFARMKKKNPQKLAEIRMINPQSFLLEQAS